jgi:outer membrane protein OmpA-like peptidoglycan-associated protein
MRSPIFRATFAALAVAILSATSVIPLAVAEEVTLESLIDSLTPTKTRDPGRAAREKEFDSFLDTLRTKKTRQITMQERTEVATFVEENDLPSIDLEVYFDYDSSALTQVAIPKLSTLGRAFSDDRLKGKTFLIGGHTDARGSDAYNQSLSERRTDAVKQYLMDNFGIDPTTLVAIGYGEERLKNPAAPEADENRRVQVVTLSN